MAEITTIFWDNDGILVDTEHLYFEATRLVLQRIDYALSEEEYIQLFLREGTGIKHLGTKLGLSEERQLEIRAERNSEYSRLLAESDPVIPGVREVLERLSGKFQMGVVTSSRKDHFQIIHEKSRLLPYFEFVLASGDYTRAKPYPDPYLKALRVSDTPAETALVIEDSERGLRAARAAGVMCWVIPSSLTRESDFSAAERVLNSIAEIPDLLIPAQSP